MALTIRPASQNLPTVAAAPKDLVPLAERLAEARRLAERVEAGADWIGEALRLAIGRAPEATEFLREIKVRIAVRRLAGRETADPFEAVLHQAFPRGTAEGDFLEQLLLGQSWRSDAVLGATEPPETVEKRRLMEVLLEQRQPSTAAEAADLDELIARRARERRDEAEVGFPKTPREFIQFLRILVGNVMEPLERRRFVDRLARRRFALTPPPLSVRAAGAADLRRTLFPRALTQETIYHLELAARLIDRLEKFGAPILDEPMKRELARIGEAQWAIASRLFIGHGAERQLLERLNHELEAAVTGTGSTMLAVSYRAHRLRLIDRPRSHRLTFEQFQRTHFTPDELARLAEHGQTRRRRREEYFSLMAGLLAAKRVALRLLDLDPRENWPAVDFHLGSPILNTTATVRRGERRLLLASANRGDLGIAIGLLEPTPGASGLSAIELFLDGPATPQAAAVPKAVATGAATAPQAVPTAPTARVVRVGEAVASLLLHP